MAGVSNRQFSMRVGVDESTLYAWFKDETPTFRRFLVPKIAAALGVEPSAVTEKMKAAGVQPMWKIGQKPGVSFKPKRRALKPVEETALDQNIEVGSYRPIVEIPLFNLSVAAGEWADVSELEDVHLTAEQIQQGLFRVRISGDSMKPKYKTGDVVEFLCLRVSYDGFEPGLDYYVQRSDGMATFKRCEAIDEEIITMRALNRKKYPGKFTVERGLIVRAARAVAKVELLG